jgi:predicted Zn-ribbon and HTH transcriptional regulator
MSGCPRCGSQRIRSAQNANVWESLRAFLGLGPVRCRDCESRFSEARLWIPGLIYARCPKCLRQDLSDWAEKYYYPSKLLRVLTYVGAKRQRCPACRVNFVSFFPRRREFVPSWKRKNAEAETPSAIDPRNEEGAVSNSI